MLYRSNGATLDLREAVTTLEDTERTARRVFGGSHPLTAAIEDGLRPRRRVSPIQRSKRLRSFRGGEPVNDRSM